MFLCLLIKPLHWDNFNLKGKHGMNDDDFMALFSLCITLKNIVILYIDRCRNDYSNMTVWPSGLRRQI